jgi:phytoene desaturase
LAAAACLAAAGYKVTVLERHAQIGGKAARYAQDGFVFDEGPSIVVMPWVYEDLFARCGRQMSDYLVFDRLDPAFRIFDRQHQPIDIPAQEAALLDTVAAISPPDARALKQLLARCDFFAKVFGHDFYERMFATWRDILFSRLLPSALILSPQQNFITAVQRRFKHELIRALLVGFPIYAGLDPRQAPASLLLIPWTIMREGVWYPRGGIHAIAQAIAKLATDLGATIHLNSEVTAIDVDASDRVQGIQVNKMAARFDYVVSNSDYVYTHQLLYGKNSWPAAIEQLRAGKAQPSASFLTLELGVNRILPAIAHHTLLLNGDPQVSYREIFDEEILPARPPLYINAPARSDATVAPAGKDNLFVVVSVPARREPPPPPSAYEEYAEALLQQIEAFGFPDLRRQLVLRRVTSPLTFEQRLSAFRGSIYGLGPAHNILYGAFRPLNQSQYLRGLYFVGGGVQPGAGMPLVVQSGKIVANLIQRNK